MSSHRKLALRKRLTAITDPTCRANGTAVYTCTECGDTYSDSIPALGHSDADNDGYCDRCDFDMTSPQTSCSHLCHKTGFLGFIWKIVNLFNKLFRINQYCECGTKHW